MSLSQETDEVTHGVETLEIQHSQQPTSDWCNVTDLFGTAANELQVGQLVHVQHFNLFDSMSALELMDPKMDAGMQLQGSAPPSVAQRLRENMIPLQFTSARDILATMDELFRSEVAWMSGQPLAQTLLTCMYLHKDVLRALLNQIIPLEKSRGVIEDQLEMRLHTWGGSVEETLLLVLTAYCVMVLETSNHVREVVIRADIYEEEDFSPGNGFDLTIFSTWTQQAREKLWAFAIRRMETILHQSQSIAASSSKGKGSTKKSSSKSKKVSTSTSSESNHSEGVVLDRLDINPRISAYLSEALLRRLLLRRTLLSVYSNLGFAEHLCNLSTCNDLYVSAQNTLSMISTEVLEFDAECFSGKVIGFDAMLSRLLLSGSPPREVQFPSQEEAIKTYQGIVGEMMMACQPGPWTSMEDVRIFLCDFSRQKPSILARSYVLLLLYCDKKIYGQHSFMEWLSQDMLLNGVPSVLLSTQEGVHYSSRVIETLYESLKVYLYNRSRQRARVEVLLEDWAILQTDAAAVDERFITEMSIPKASYPRYFTAWSLEHVTILMIHYVLLGFEMELYAPTEFSTMFWYLDFLCGSRLQNLKFTQGFMEKMQEIMEDQPSRQSHTTSTQRERSQARFQREIKFTEMQRSMMRGYLQLFAALQQQKLVNMTPPAFGSPIIRFQHRFMAFQSLHFPAPLTYDDYAINSDFSRYEVDLIYESAKECFKVAALHGEDVVKTLATSNLLEAVHGREVVDMTQVVDAILMSIPSAEMDRNQAKSNRKSRVLSTPTTASVEYDFTYHACFPVVRFTTN